MPYSVFQVTIPLLDSSTPTPLLSVEIAALCQEQYVKSAMIKKRISVHVR
jgi:hypothetical protein